MARTAKTTEEKDNGYEVPKGEEGFVHVKIRHGRYNQDTGRPEMPSFIQKYDPKGWLNFLKHKNGVTILDVLHLPKEAISIEDFEKEQSKPKK